jgi:hypothetical protein
MGSQNSVGRAQCEWFLAGFIHWASAASPTLALKIAPDENATLLEGIEHSVRHPVQSLARLLQLFLQLANARVLSHHRQGAPPRRAANARRPRRRGDRVGDLYGWFWPWQLSGSSGRDMFT